MNLPKLAARGIVCFLALGCFAGIAQADLVNDFRNPPPSAKPRIWWHWMNGNISRAGITADLTAMKQVGLSGAYIFNINWSIPDGPIKYMSPEWRDLVKFAAVEAKRLDLSLGMNNAAGWSNTGGPWIQPSQAMQMVTISETPVKGGTRFSAVLQQPQTNWDYYRDIAVLAIPKPGDDTQRIKSIRAKAVFDREYGIRPDLTAYPDNTVILRASIVNLTSKLGQGGQLDWDVPAGDWVILRIGYTPTGARNFPPPESGLGLECDKLSRDGMDAHWAAGIAPLLNDLGPLVGKTFSSALIDSYEVGCQNWSHGFRDEFIKKRGYDPIQYLPTLTGRVIDSGEVSERFLWDLRRTIGDLFAENYFGYFADLCHKNGLSALIEPYDGPFDSLLSGAKSDIPMGEFWFHETGSEAPTPKLAASIAHIYGHKLAGAEAFTGDWPTSRWLETPYTLKMSGDQNYCAGVNFFVIHRYAHQPWPDKLPGMTMGCWGIQYERTTTWWQQSAAWIKYLTRCQSLLQQGLPVADILWCAGENSPDRSPHDLSFKRIGFDYDTCNADVIINRLSVKNGRLVLPDGMSYRVLVMPNNRFMTPALLTKLRELIKDGATVISPKPDKSPSLAGYPDCDATVARMGEEIWGECDGISTKEHAFGKGKVMWQPRTEDVLAEMGVAPDCAFDKPRGMSWTHRTVGDSEIYFVCNPTELPADVVATFRVSGKAPELWYPETGQTEPVPVWQDKDGRTTMPLHFDPVGSVFVVFRKTARPAEHVTALTGPVVPAPDVQIQSAIYAADDGSGSKDVTEILAGMIKSGQFTLQVANNLLGGDPAPDHSKHLNVEYTLNGKAIKRAIRQGEKFAFLPELEHGAAPLPSWRLVSSSGKTNLQTFVPGIYEFTTSSGRAGKLNVGSVQAAMEITGPWTLRFPPNWQAPAQVTLEKLMSWTEHADQGIKYFSGTAQYEKTFDIKAKMLAGGAAVYLDLGCVRELAEVTLNGKNLGVWWKPPFAKDVTAILKPGRNTLKVRVTNTWVNRLIGDEQFPDDYPWAGNRLESWPKWFTDGTPRPEPRRLTFTTWKHWSKDDVPLPSGLLGPVVIRAAAKVTLK